MKSLKKRVDDLERGAGRGKEAIFLLAVDYAIDGGLVYKGQFYKDKAALLHALGIKQEAVYFLGFPAEDTAAELLAQAEKVESGRRPALKEAGKSAEVTAEQAQCGKDRACQVNAGDNLCSAQDTTIITPFIWRHDPALAPRQVFADRCDTVFGGENALFKGYVGFPFQRY